VSDTGTSLIRGVSVLHRTLDTYCDVSGCISISDMCQDIDTLPFFKHLSEITWNRNRFLCLEKIEIK